MRLHVHVAGDRSNPPLVFLHGFLGNQSDWDGIVAALRQTYWCIAIDLPGHGQSLQRDNAAYSIPGSAHCVLATLDQLGVNRAALLGYSMGGRVALYLATTAAPRRWPALIVESATAGIDDPAERAARSARDDALAEQLERSELPEFLADWYAQPLFDSLRRHENGVADLIARRRTGDRHELAQSLRGMGAGRQEPLWHALPSIPCPTLFVAGADDPRYVEISQRLHEAYPHGRRAIIPAAGHNTHLEQPDTFMKQVTAFLGETYPSAESVLQGQNTSDGDDE